MKIVRVGVVALFFAVTCNFVNAKEEQKHTIVTDAAAIYDTMLHEMAVLYNILPCSVDNMYHAISKGTLYGRLRTNAFRWDYKDSINNHSNRALGMGGSILYKTAPIGGLSATASFHYSSNPFDSIRGEDADVGYVRAGKDTFSRYNVLTTSDWSMSVLSQAYIQYNFSKISFRFGRQAYQSFLTSPNDTKMIPNTFEGYTLAIREIPKTVIRAAYFYAQKLRDHTQFHDVLTYKDSSGHNWRGNDDAVSHRGLSYENLSVLGKEKNSLLVVDFRNESVKNLQIDFTYGAVPGLLSSLRSELNYEIPLTKDFTLTPGIRHMQQFDDGAGAIGGASLSGDLAGLKGAQGGYSDASSLEGAITMSRLVLTDGILKFQLGYSAVADKGDIVAPWRGFPTAGYTRAMGQYNWRANTKTTMAEVYYDLGRAKILKGFSILARYLVQDFDERKQISGVQADSHVTHMDFRKKFTQKFDAKFRVALVDGNTRIVNGINKDSYNEYRFELNYLF